MAAFALRLYRLNEGIWYDEVLTYVKYVKMPFWRIITTFDSQNQHFLYSLLAHASISILGDSTWAMRLPAVLFGVGSIWALYLLARQVGSEREALLSSAMLTFSYHHIWFSQSARGYSGLLFWTLLASWLFLRGLHEGKPKFWVLYAVAAALGVYTHMTMLFVISGHFVIYLMMLLTRPKEIWPHRWTGFFLGFCLTALLVLQFYAPVLPQILSGFIGEKSTVTAWTHPIWTLLELVKGMEISFGGSFVAFLAFLIFGAGFLSFIRENPVVIQLLIIPSLICTAVVLGMGHHLWPRFFFFTMGFGVLIFVRGTMLLGYMIVRILHGDPRKSIPLGTSLCAGLILASTMSIPSVYAPKQDYAGAIAFVEQEKEPDDVVVTVGLATFPYAHFYKRDWGSAEMIEELNAIRSRAKRTWLIYTFPLHLQSVYPDIMASIQQDFKVVKQFYGTLGDGTVFVCRSDNPPLIASSSK